VSDGRFITPVELDDGTLVVVPPSSGEHPTISEADAAAKIWASPTPAGYHAGPLGFGIVTISLDESGIPTVTSLPAWVGVATASLVHCPEETAPTGPTTTRPTLPSSGYGAVVIGAEAGSPAVAYTARSSTCGSPPTGPSVAVASEVVSVPWVASGTVEAGQLVVQASLPPCGAFRGASVGGSAASTTVTLLAVVPDVVLPCPAPQRVMETVQLGSPNSPGAPPSLVSPSTLIEHGPLGAIRTAEVETASPSAPSSSFSATVEAPLSTWPSETVSVPTVTPPNEVVPAPESSPGRRCLTPYEELRDTHQGNLWVFDLGLSSEDPTVVDVAESTATSALGPSHEYCYLPGVYSQSSSSE